MHATKRQAELGRDLHQGALIAASRFADHGAAALRPGSAQGFGDGGDRVGDPQGAARGIGDVEPVLRNIDADAQVGLQQRKDRLKPIDDELPWRTFREEGARRGKKGKVLWHRIVTRGGPALPFALKTAKAGRRIEIACELVFHPESISPSCPPFLPQTQRSQRTAGQHVQSRGT